MIMVVYYINTGKDVINETTRICRAAIAIAAKWRCFSANNSATITIIAVFVYVFAFASTAFLIYSASDGARIAMVMIRLQVNANIVTACL
jgi:hypothetical protein